MSNQLVKKNPAEGYQNVFPKTFIDAIKDKESGVSLQEILQGFNMYFLSYNGSRALTRCKVPTVLRKEGLWITYVLYDHTVVTEWYNSDQMDDNSWSMDSNWRVASNALVGDISVSADGYWVINGEKTEAKAQGEQGVTPLLRVGANNKLQVSYNAGKAWKDISDYIVPKFRWNQSTGTSAGTIQISMDLGKTWTNLSNEITNNLRISRYIGINESLPTSGVAEGTIYMKGPYYDESDTSNTKPIYRMWVYAWKDNTLAWQDNGEFTVISAGVVQERGNSTTEVMSQDAVTKELTKLESEVIYDVTANNKDAKFASLSALLSSENLSTLIPVAVRCGGMSIRFVQSSDNKYVQCRLMADKWSIDIHDWAFMEGDVYIDNPEFIDAKTDVEGRLLEGIKKDGTKYLAGSLQLNGNVLIGGTIENKDLKEKLDSTLEDIEDIQQRLIFDNIVTEESTNAVTSKGIYNAINANILYQEIAKTDVIYLTKGDTSVYDATALRAANLDTSKNYRIKVVFNTSLTVEQNRTTILYNTGGGNATLVNLEPGNYTEFYYNFKPTSSNIFFKIYCYQDNIPEGMFYSMEIDEPVYNCHRLNYSLEVKENLLKSERLYLSPLQSLGSQFRTTEGHVYRINVKLSRSFGSAMYIAARNENGTNSINVCTVNMTLAATDSGYNYWFLCPYTNARIIIITAGQDTISDAPFVEVSLFSEYSEQIKDIEQNNISSVINNGKTANALAKISGKLAKKEGEDNNLSYDVCIIGAGSAGLNAAYPLIQQGKSVCVVDKNSEIGGTMARAWINCCAATPDTPFFREYVKEMLFQGTARYVNTQYQDIIENKDSVDYSRSLIRTEFRNDGQEEVCITFDVDSYINKMYEKLAGATFLLNTEFVSASTTNNIVNYIVIKDLLSNKNININAKVFIDCSADDVLVRYINNVEGEGYFIGTDSSTRYESNWGFTEEHAASTSIRNGLNPPTLMFRTKEGTEDLSQVSIEGLNYYLNPYYYGDASKKFLYNNSSSLVSTEAGVEGIDVVNQGSDIVKSEIIPYILPYWKYAKTNGINTYWRHGISRQKFDLVAPMLGIRETYRAACERMLHEEDIKTKITTSALNVNNILDVPIGIANHPVDFHGNSGSGIDSDAINAARKPYFVKFGSIVPLNLKNVFVASRGAGFTHIAAASVRLNKSIMELGYAAGCASNYMIEKNDFNSRNVDIDYLKSETKIYELTNEIINIIN